MPPYSVQHPFVQLALRLKQGSLRIMPRALGLLFSRSLFLLAVAGIIGACAASEAEVNRAKTAGYDTDFSTVYGEVVAVVSRLYPKTAENAVDGVIRTAWHRVAVQSGSGRSNDQQSSQLAGTRTGSGLTTTAASDRKNFYIRFRIHVVGGKPWRVRIVGEASEWAMGDVPMPLNGAEVPPWLKGRTDALRVEIYDHLKKYAVKVEAEIPQAEGTIISLDEPASYGDIPAGAEELLSEIHRALGIRSFEDLRHQLADDVQWSPGEVGSADIAMVMWQADTSLLEAMRIAIGRGCVAGDGAVIVSCPRAYSETPNYKGYRLIAEKRGDRWLVTAFVKGD